MPRGIPNAKRDETGMRYTSFHVPLAPNPKHSGTTYLKSESQTLWARNAVRKNKMFAEEASQLPSDQRRGSSVIVIHPGSRLFRIGKASEVTPISVPSVVARKTASPMLSSAFVEGVCRPRKGRSHSQNRDEQAASRSSDDPFDEKLSAITISLRDRMRFYKRRVMPNAAEIASTFNRQFKPEIIQDANDPFRVDWISESSDEYFVGEKALRLADPEAQGYITRWPIYGGKFNTRDYPSLEMILSDIELIIRETLQERLDVGVHDYKNYSVVLVVPDFYEKAYVREIIRMLLVTMEFKQICVQQESLAATYGAGISNACVVDIGATKTSVACVDEGLVIADTRLFLDIGGNDITEFLHILLERVSFPYREINLARWYDWGVIEDLKARLCTLAEGDVGLNLYDFVVRRPGKPTEKYGLRAYDEIILAPMCIFEPRIIEFDRKRLGFHPTSYNDVSEEIIEHASDQMTQAMMISTQHLIPASPPTQGLSDALTSRPSSPGPGAQDKSAGHNGQENGIVEKSAKQEQEEGTVGANESAPQHGSVTNEGSAGSEEATVDAEGGTREIAAATQPVSRRQSPNASAPTPFAGAYTIDVAFEASKLPLDVAIFNSARAAGGDDRIRKYLQAILVIGGTALIPGMVHALESRLQAIATPLVPNMERVTIIPPPKEVDPRVLAWKGAAVLGKMDGASDLWLTPADWDVMGMRGLKERCFYL